MNRLFAENDKRRIQSLDGVWQFRTDENREGVEKGWAKALPPACRDVSVPSLWTCTHGYYHYEGVGWYFRTFSGGGFKALVFHGVSGLADVYVDGLHAGQHYGGFTGFQVLLKNLSEGEHFLAIRVDSTHTATDTIPLYKVDWYHHGGISRGVELHSHINVRINHFAIRYTLSNMKEKTADADIECTLRFSTNTSDTIRRTVKIFMNGKAVTESAVSLTNDGETKISFRAEQINLWSPASPALYRFDAEIAGDTGADGDCIADDGIADMTGFREIKAREGKIFLNGCPIRIKGVNRHEDHPDFGYALPLALQYKDMDIIKEAGCNAIRGSHYPNAQTFLDLCDREGILFWEEIPQWQFFKEALENPLMNERGLSMHTEMVERDLNHPSIILWGLHNENDTRAEACFSLSKKYVERIRSIDKSRLITYATMMPLEDICFSLVDVVSVNKYFGWYQGELADWKSFLRDFYKKLDDEGCGDKPVIISEFGADGIPGVRNFEDQKGTEDYQAEYLEYTLDLFMNDPRLAGSYIWQYCDIRVWDALGRARGFNNKGIVDEYRRPKLSYKTVREHYGNKKL
ncbi:beta-glucuronidase [Spirochaetia bacterium]|nr:beta-glucuronidase [Spirochaetia bacterium]